MAGSQVLTENYRLLKQAQMTSASVQTGFDKRIDTQTMTDNLNPITNRDKKEILQKQPPVIEVKNT